MIWHRVVAISVVHATIERQLNGSERYLVNVLRTGGEADWDEERLLRRFWKDYFPHLKPRLVTWNGKGFDMPVLRARSMIYGIAAGTWFLQGSRWDSYTQRFTPDRRPA